MRILLFGANGQLGTALCACAPRHGIELVACTRAEVDLEQAEQVAAAVAGASAIDAVVNAAAYTAVDKAETDEDRARRVNALAPRAMADAAARRGIPLLHVSTDYVFDGMKEGAYLETDAPAPASAYGRTKLEGEEAVRKANPRHLILRTSWVFGASGANFVKTMLRLGAERELLRVVADQHGRPTFAGDLAEVIIAMAEIMAPSRDEADARWGTYHVAGAGQTTWHGFAQEIFARRPVKARLEPIPTAAYPTPARRPANSVLDCTKVERIFGLRMRPWTAGLDETLAAL